jgi:hypothetical protein
VLEASNFSATVLGQGQIMEIKKIGNGGGRPVGVRKALDRDLGATESRISYGLLGNMYGYSRDYWYVKGFYLRFAPPGDCIFPLPGLFNVLLHVDLGSTSDNEGSGNLPATIPYCT